MHLFVHNLKFEPLNFNDIAYKPTPQSIHHKKSNFPGIPVVYASTTMTLSDFSFGLALDKLLFCIETTKAARHSFNFPFVSLAVFVATPRKVFWLLYGMPRPFEWQTGNQHGEMVFRPGWLFKLKFFNVFVAGLVLVKTFLSGIFQRKLFNSTRHNRKSRNWVFYETPKV